MVKRNHAQEQALALERRESQVLDLRQERESGLLGEDIFLIAQFIVLCTLPYRATQERQVSRRARLSDGSTLTVTYTAMRPGVPLAFGADRKLLMWMLDRAIKSDSPVVSWSAATECLKDLGMNDSGKNIRDLRNRYQRIAGLAITVERKTADGEQGRIIPLLEEWALPSSIDISSERSAQPSLPLIDKQFGFKISERLWRDVKQFYVAIPKLFWLRTNGSAQRQDLQIWLLYRCWCAQSESIIPWEALRQQFWQDDSNIYRLKQRIKQAVKEVLAIWPEARIEVRANGLWVDRAAATLLPQDPLKNRQRRLSTAAGAL